MPTTRSLRTLVAATTAVVVLALSAPPAGAVVDHADVTTGVLDFDGGGMTLDLSGTGSVCFDYTIPPTMSADFAGGTMTVSAFSSWHEFFTMGSYVYEIVWDLDADWGPYSGTYAGGVVNGLDIGIDIEVHILDSECQRVFQICSAYGWLPLSGSYSGTPGTSALLLLSTGTGSTTSIDCAPPVSGIMDGALEVYGMGVDFTV